MNTENRYPKDVVERIAINLYRQGIQSQLMTRYSTILSRAELEQDDLTAVEMVECIISRITQTWEQ